MEQPLNKDDMFPPAVMTAKKIASKLPKELGFVNRAALLESFSRKELLTIGKKAFCHFHLRRDLQLTIYELGVRPENQGEGLGGQIIEKMIVKGKKVGATCLLAKCPIDLKSNGFYQAQGFKKVRVEQGRVRKLNVWVLEL